MNRAVLTAMVAMGLLAARAGGQGRPIQNGRLLDANYGIGRTRVNSIRQADGTVDGNLLVTGQVGGWYRFRGDVGYYGASQLRLDLPSAQFDDFLSRSSGLPRLAAGVGYGLNPYLSRSGTVLGPYAIARGATSPGSSTARSPYLRSAEVRALISSAVEAYKPIFPEISRHLRVEGPVGVTALAGPAGPAGPGRGPAWTGAVRPSASSLFGVLGDKTQRRLAERLQETDRPGQPRRVGEAVAAAVETGSPGAEPLGEKAGQPQQPTGAPEPGRPAARPGTLGGPTGEDVFVDMLILMRQMRSQGEQAPQPSSTQPPRRQTPGPPLPGETPQDAADRFERQLDRQAVERSRDRLILHGLAGRGRSDVNVHLAKAEARLAEGKYYDAAGEFEVAAVLAPENPLPALGGALARLAADEPLTAAFQLRTAFWRFLALMETQVDVDGMLGRKVVDLRLRQIEERIARQKQKPEVPLVFLAAFLRHARGEKEKAAAHARTLKTLAGDDRIYRTFAQYVLTGKIGTSTKTSRPAGAKSS